VVFSRQRNGLALFGQPGHNAPGDLFVMAWTGASFGAPDALVTAASQREQLLPQLRPRRPLGGLQPQRGLVQPRHRRAPLGRPRRAPGAAPVRLAAADLGDLGNSWPKFSPFLQRFQGEPLLWFTFSSEARLRAAAAAADARARDAHPQLWMAAFRPNRVGDPSATAFWLPFQDLTSGNHIGQWAEQVQRMGCTSDRDCVLQERCALISLTASQYGCVPR
jgi:hypothetical protein